MKDLVHQVDEILLSFWDPIGVGDSPKAKDEYSASAPAIARHLRQGVSANVLAVRLLRIEQHQLGLPGDSDRAAKAAREMCALLVR